jgi:hypothetical protein
MNLSSHWYSAPSLEWRLIGIAQRSAFLVDGNGLISVFLREQSISLSKRGERSLDFTPGKDHRGGKATEED